MVGIPPHASGGAKTNRNLTVVEHPAHAAERGVGTAAIGLAQKAVVDAVESLPVFRPAGHCQDVASQQISPPAGGCAVGIGVDDLKILARDPQAYSPGGVARLFALIIPWSQLADGPAWNRQRGPGRSQ